MVGSPSRREVGPLVPLLRRRKALTEDFPLHDYRHPEPLGGDVAQEPAEAGQEPYGARANGCRNLASK